MWKIFIYILLFTTTVFAKNDLSVVTEEEYYQTPDLFQLDVYPKCLSQPDGVFCVGTFELLPKNPSRIYDIIKILEKDRLNFNHSRIHRAICLGSLGTCPRNETQLWKANFESCVYKITKEKYDLDTRLVSFSECRNRDHKWPWDIYNTLFSMYIIVIVALNALGTYFHGHLKENNTTGYSWLLCFSLKENWKKYKEEAKQSDNRFSTFKVFNGLRGIMVLAVLLAHIPLGLIIYSANPRDFEESLRSPTLYIIGNGSVSVQIFFLISAFLQTFQMLILAENITITFKDFVMIIFDRIIRLCPLFLTAVGFTATLAPYINGGPLWGKYVEAEAVVCRETFWTQFFLMQHWYAPGCVPQAWYLAVGFQVYVICGLIILYIIRTKKDAIPTLLRILVASLIGLYVIVYIKKLEPSYCSVSAENLLDLFKNDKSFINLYQSVWGNLPSSIIGIMSAYVYYDLRKRKVDLKDSKLLQTGMTLSVPAIIVFVIGGVYIIENISSRRWLMSLYGTVDKPAFSILVLVLIFGCLFEIDHPYRRFFEWPTWIYLSRISLGSLLFHTVVGKTNFGTKLGLQTYSNALLGSELTSGILATYLMVLPLTLMIEIPILTLYKRYIFAKYAQNITHRNGTVVTNANGTKNK